MKTTSEFIKYNEQIIPKPLGTDYDLIAGKIYSLNEDKYCDDLYLKEDKDFEFPERYYLNSDDNRFINKVVNTFNNTTKLTTGVLLSGLKGSGKTLMAKKIAVSSNLPIIVVNQNVSANDIEPFFAKINTDVCVIFDEIDKYWSTRYLLGFLDGVKPSCKKLVLCTCNDEDEIDEYLNDRCSRIRYKKSFNCLTKDVIEGIMNDVLTNKEKAKSVTEFIYSAIKVVSYDNVMMFAEEVKNNPDESYETILADMNIEKR